MTVSPHHWGKGLGKQLLKRGLEEVDKAGQYDSSLPEKKTGLCMQSPI